MSAKAPAVYTLLPYQRALADDRSRLVVALFARQCGKSFTAALMAVLDCLERPGTLWVCLSRGERQSREWMEKVRMHLSAVKMMAEFLETRFDMQTAQMECRLPNGSRIIGLPANPDTARGFSGNVILDEFAFHQDARAIWRALVPAITRGYRLVVVSTPNGTGNVFHELCEGDLGRHFSHHKVTLPEAVVQGLKADVATLRAAVDEDTWRQEYLCEFVDESAAFLPYDLIAKCERAELDGLPVEDPDTASLRLRGPLFAGFDVARKGDLSVIWVNELCGGRHVCRRRVEMRNMPFSAQRDVLWPVLALPNLRRCCIDASGLGMQMAEEAVQRFGSWRVEGVTFSAPVKEALAGPLKAAMEDGDVLFAPSPAVRDDLHKVRRSVTAAGNVRFVAESDAAGHADRFWALALAIEAARQCQGGPVGMDPLADLPGESPRRVETPDHSDDRY